MRNFDFNGLMQSPPRCPLCFAPMELNYEPVRKIKVLVCKRDRIGINIMDPLVGKWEQKREKISCPNCNADMRVFFTSVGYMKAKCPKKGCGCGVETKNVLADVLGGLAPALKLDGVQVDAKNTDKPMVDEK